MGLKYTNAGFEKIVQGVYKEYEKLDHDANYYELSIVLPAINMFINGAHGVLFSSNFFAASNSARMMLEAIGALAYFEINDPVNEDYNAFLRKKRIRKQFSDGIIIDNDTKLKLCTILAKLKKNNSNNEKFSMSLSELEKMVNTKLWVDVGIRQLLDSIDPIGNYKNSKGLYDHICEYVHFGSPQLLAILSKPKRTEDGRSFSMPFIIGPKLLSRKDRAVFRELVWDTYKNMIEIIQYSAKYNNKTTNRFNYKPVGDVKLIPKEYQELFGEIIE